ncbi:MAG: PAS domain-containing protein [Anaerolineae bacterium]|nr:PAS domain-containing protein [Anaerolineae bacterium]
MAAQLQRIWRFFGAAFTHQPDHEQEALIVRLRLENAALQDSTAHETEERKRTENHLRAVQQRQADFLRANPDLILRIAQDGTYIDIHAPRPEMLIATRDQLIGKKINTFLPSDISDLYMQHIEIVLQTRQEASFDYALVVGSNSGEFEARMMPSGQSEVLTIIRNITEQRRMAKQNAEYLSDMKALQEIFFILTQINDLEMLYSNMVRLIKENLHIDRVAVFLFDPKTNLLKGTYGISPEGHFRNEQDYVQVVTDNHWTHRIMNSPARTQLLENVPIYENGIQIADGCWHTSSALWNGQEVIGFLVTDNLISRKPPRPYQAEISSILGSTYGQLIHLKQTQLTLSKSEERNRILLNAIPDLVFRLDYEGNFLDYHSSDPNDLAMPPEVFLGRNIIDVMPPHLAQLITDNISIIIQTKKAVTFEYSLSVESTSQFEARMFPSGEREIMSVVRDVTELNKLEEQTFKLAVETARTKVLTEFVQNASHELRTPLAIISAAAFLLPRLKDEAKQKKYMEQINYQVKQLTDLLDMIFVMTRLDTDVAVNRQSFKLDDILTVLEAQIKDDLLQRNLTFDFSLAPSLPALLADRALLQDALGHLLNNAIRFTQDGGKITLTAYPQEKETVIEIQDTGMGISPESLGHIFERFWREDKAHSTPGFGLGLPIVQKIVEKHHGKIDVVSEVGKGSTFRIVLPTAQPC